MDKITTVTGVAVPFKRANVDTDQIIPAQFQDPETGGELALDPPVIAESYRAAFAAHRAKLHEIFLEAGLEWREAGCSMCLAMNPDKLEPGERCAATSNRNFEGRQGKGGRTHLVSPLVAAATAIRGTLSSPWDLGFDTAGTAYSTSGKGV